MIDAIGETPEFRKQRWDNATTYQREKYEKEMKEWAYLYPFAAEVMLGPTPCKLTEEEIMELIKLGEERRAINS